MDDEGWRRLEGYRVIGEVTLYASWTRVIDDIAVTYSLPHNGDSAEEAKRSITLPEDLPLELTDVNLLNGNTWENIDTIGGADTYLLVLFLTPREGSRFLAETTEDDETVYTGNISVNGHQPDTVYLYSETKNGITDWILIIDYRFQLEEP